MFELLFVGWAGFFAHTFRYFRWAKKRAHPTSLLIALIPILCQAEFKDPTKPDYPTPTVVISSDNSLASDKLVLSAIWITATSRRATINGITVKQGQSLLNNVKVIKITKNTVFLNQHGSIKILRLLQSPYKKSK